MDASDWVIVLGFSALVPVFVFAMIVARRPPSDDGGEVEVMDDRPEILQEQTRFQQIVTDTVANLPGSIAIPGGLRFAYRGLAGRAELRAKQTQIHLETGDLVQQRVEVATNGFPMSLFLSPGEHRLQMRGSRT